MRSLLGVREYFQYHPTGDYLSPRLQGSCLVEGEYQPIATTTLPNNVLSLASQVLALELSLQAGELRFYSPQQREILLKHEEVQRSRSLAAKLRELGIDPNTL